MLKSHTYFRERSLRITILLGSLIRAKFSLTPCISLHSCSVVFAVHFCGTGYHISAVSEHVREHLSSLALRIGSIRKSGSCLPSGNIQHLLTHCCVSLELISAVLAMLMVIKPTCFHLISCFHCFTGNIKKRGRSLLCFPILPLRTILPLRSRN